MNRQEMHVKISLHDTWVKLRCVTSLRTGSDHGHLVGLKHCCPCYAGFMLLNVSALLLNKWLFFILLRYEMALFSGGR